VQGRTVQGQAAKRQQAKGQQAKEQVVEERQAKEQAVKGRQARGRQAKERQPKAQPIGRVGSARPVSSPRHTRPMADGVRPGTLDSPSSTAPGRLQEPRLQEALRTDRNQEAPQTGQTQHARQAQRMPFILLLVGLLGGALVSLLVISTTLDEGAYRINSLTQQNDDLSKYEQILNQQVNLDRNEATIYKEAYQLGMRTDKDLRFMNVESGKISVSQAVTP
jgi:hypothetical protein